MAELLTSVAAVKSWLNITASDADTILGGLVSAASRYVLNNINRDFIANRAVTERRDGDGRPTMLLRNWPVTDYTALTLDNLAVPVSAPIGQGAGYFVEMWDGIGFGVMTSVELFGQVFARGRGNVVHSYRAGYRMTEAATIGGAPYEITPSAADGPWASDLGVSYNGTAFVAVASTPTAGQYTVNAAGKYTFAAADTGKAVAISYGYVLADLAQAANEIVGERYRVRERIGQNSKVVGGETINFATGKHSAFVESLLNPHRRVVPL